MSDRNIEELIIRWMDGEDMTEDEMNRLKTIHSEEPEMILNPQDFSEVRSELRQMYPAGQDLPEGELFDTTLLSRLESEISATEKIQDLEDQVTTLALEQSHQPTETNVIPFPWLKTAVAMAACFLFGLLINNAFFTGKQSDAPLVTSTHTPLTPVVYSAHQDLSGNVITEGENTIIRIEGLEAIPDDVDLFSIAKKQKAIKVIPNKFYPVNDL